MTGWIIFGSIVLFLVWLFTRSVTVVLDYGERFDIKIRFLFIKLFPTRPKKNKKPKKPKKTKTVKVEINTEDDGTDTEIPENVEDGADTGQAENGGTKKAKTAKKSGKKQKKKLGIDLEQIVEYVKSASPPVKRLFKKIKFTGLYLDYTVGTDDAAKTAIKYGGLCAAVYPLLEWLREHFTVKIKKVRINADFSREKDDIKAHCNIKLRVSTAIACALWLGVRLLRTYLRYSNSASAPKKKAKPARV